MSKFKKGQFVKISEDLSLTYEVHGDSPIMEQMKGNVYRIGSIIGNCITITKPGSNTYSFHPNDLIPLEEIKVPEPVLFDPKNLDIAP